MNKNIILSVLFGLILGMCLLFLFVYLYESEKYENKGLLLDGILCGLDYSIEIDNNGVNNKTENGVISYCETYKWNMSLDKYVNR